jgi:hypothetical protein
MGSDMITFDQLRSALLDADPHAALDRLVRAELSAGRKTQAIYDELLSHLDAVRAMPEYTDELEDPLGDTLDALCGWVHPDCAYKDAPDPVVALPTEEEIAKLPRWARVAFAARCARRVLSLYALNWSSVPQKYVQAVAQAIEIAERSAAMASADETAASAAQAAELSAEVAANEISTGNANAAVSASNAAAAALGGLNSTTLAVSAIQAAAAAAEFSERNGFVPRIQAEFRSDFDRAVQLAEQQHWDDDTGVPPEVFGPLWRERPPTWPAEIITTPFATPVTLRD